MQACNIIYNLLNYTNQHPIIFLHIIFHNIFNMYIHPYNQSVGYHISSTISYIHSILNVFLSEHSLTNHFYLLLITNINFTFRSIIKKILKVT